MMPLEEEEEKLSGTTEKFMRLPVFIYCQYHEGLHTLLCVSVAFSLSLPPGLLAAQRTVVWSNNFVQFFVAHCYLHVALLIDVWRLSSLVARGAHFALLSVGVLDRSCYVTNGWPHSLFAVVVVVVVLLLLIMHSTHTFIHIVKLRANGNKHTHCEHGLRMCVCVRTFTEVTRDSVAVVIVIYSLLDRTQLVVQRAEQRSDGKESIRDDE